MTMPDESTPQPSAPLGPQQVKQLPQEAVEEAFKSVFPAEETRERLPGDPKTVVLVLEGHISAAATARVIASKLRQQNAQAIRKAIASHLTPPIERWSLPGKVAKDIDRKILDALAKQMKLLPEDVMGEMLDLQMTVRNQEEVLRNLDTRIAAGDVEHVVLAREVTEGEKKVVRVLWEYTASSEIKRPEVYEQWNQIWETVTSVLQRAGEAMSLSLQEQQAVEYTIGEAIPALVAANNAKIEASKAGAHLATSLKRAGFLVDVPEEGTEKVASVIMALQAPVALMVDAGLITEIRTYMRTLAMSTTAPDVITRIGIKFETTARQFDDRLRQYAEELAQVAAKLPIT
jgi:hypothetical protein